MAPDKADLGSILYKEHVKPKAELVSQWAREAGHSLDGKLRCVCCGLSINMQRHAEYLKIVLNMKCMGGAGLKPHLALHSKARNRSDYDHNDSQLYKFHGVTCP